MWSYDRKTQLSERKVGKNQKNNHSLLKKNRKIPFSFICGEKQLILMLENTDFAYNAN